MIFALLTCFLMKPSAFDLMSRYQNIKFSNIIYNILMNHSLMNAETYSSGHKNWSVNDEIYAYARLDGEINAACTRGVFCRLETVPPPFLPADFAYSIKGIAKN